MARSIDDLVHRDRLYYEKFTDVPFTGTLNEDAEHGVIKNGKREGYWRLYADFARSVYEGWDDGEYIDGWHIYEEGEYRHGLRNGPWVIYEWRSGTVQSKGEYKNGEKEGPWADYYENGQLQNLRVYKNGWCNGPRVGYHEDGGLRYKDAYRNGNPEGLAIRYHANGQLYFKGSFDNGKEEGSHVYYNEDGTIDDRWLRSGIFRNGERVYDLPTVTDEVAALMTSHPLAAS